ncbi:related to tetracycline resistance proteins [Serendipita indica DSM 11827]|uniref:Related to tetracycline resistance proteins n=1 Tax=Serendipita indica (strain DSM 11827) TaxID=1109443 RepID=G4TK90_SERID|nr:related to tetracycline resistance proteins [Serendipita indica DSM 11827]
MSSTLLEQGPDRGDDTSREKDVIKDAVKRKYKINLASLFWCFFMYGINDGTLGPLIPVYQRYYKAGRISFIIVSLIFICNSVGFVLCSVLNVFLSGRINFSKLLVVSSILQIASYAILCAAPPFPLVCVAYFFVGAGLALLNAHGNGFMSMLKNSSQMGMAHAIYGSGALVGPLIATQFAQFSGRKWAYHYFVLLGGLLVSFTLLVFVFRGKEYDVILGEMGLVPATSRQDTEANSVTSRGREVAEEKSSGFAKIMKQVTMHVMALFVFVYVGVEVTIGGWIVTFIIRERGGGPSSGYVSSGFFGGLALGRVLLLWVNRKIGERNVVFLYTVIGIGLEFVVWFVPSLIGDAIAVSFRDSYIPQHLLTGSIGWISGFGGTGGAVVPFMTGALANRFGIRSLQPLIVAMMAVMGGLWFIVPAPSRRQV